MIETDVSGCWQTRCPHGRLLSMVCTDCGRGKPIPRPAIAGEQFGVVIDERAAPGHKTITICTEDDGNWFETQSFDAHWLPDLIDVLLSADVGAEVATIIEAIEEARDPDFDCPRNLACPSAELCLHPGQCPPSAEFFDFAPARDEPVAYRRQWGNEWEYQSYPNRGEYWEPLYTALPSAEPAREDDNDRGIHRTDGVDDPLADRDSDSPRLELPQASTLSAPVAEPARPTEVAQRYPTLWRLADSKGTVGYQQYNLLYEAIDCFDQYRTLTRENAELRADRDKWRAGRDACEQQYQEMVARVVALTDAAAPARTEARVDERDAVRYRWLRDTGDATWPPWVDGGLGLATSADYDAAIDAAMSASSAPRKE